MTTLHLRSTALSIGKRRFPRPAVVLAVLALALAAPRAAAAREPLRLALVVGVEKYGAPGIPWLSYAADDALAVRDVLVHRCHYSRVRTLVNGSVTSEGRDVTATGDGQPVRRNIARELDAIIDAANGAAASDTEVFIYFSGHGRQPSGAGPQLVPADVGVAGSPAAVDPSTTVDLYGVIERLNRIAGCRKCIVVDACRDAVEKDIDSIGAFPTLSGDETVLVLSCMAGEKSRESDEFHHGVFTHFLLEGLDGNVPEVRTANGEVRLGLVMDYASDRCSIESKKRVDLTYHGTRRWVLFSDPWKPPEVTSTGPKTLSVPEAYASVQSAIDAAASGDTIRVAPGTYRENLELKGGVRIVGTDRDSCRIEAESTSSPVATFSGADTVIVERLAFDGRGNPGGRWANPGWSYDREDWRPVLTAVVPGSPADEGGFAVGSEILTVNGTRISRMADIDMLRYDMLSSSGGARLTVAGSNGARVELFAAQVPALRVSRGGAVIRDCAFVGASGAGIDVVGETSVVQIERVAIASCGEYVLMARGGGGSVVGCELSGAARDGVIAVGGGTRMDVRDTHITGTSGVAIAYGRGANGTVSNCRATGNEYGLGVLGPDETVDARRNEFSRNRSSGIFYDLGAVGTIERNVTDDNGHSGIDTCGPGTTPVIRGNFSRRNAWWGVVW